MDRKPGTPHRCRSPPLSPARFGAGGALSPASEATAPLLLVKPGSPPPQLHHPHRYNGGASNNNLLMVVLVALCMTLVIFYYEPHVIVSQSILQHAETPASADAVYHSGGKFLVYNDKCRIPELDPMDPEVRLFHKKEKYKACTKLKLLTRVEKNGFVAHLRLDQKAVPAYTKNGVSCCFINITRKSDKKNPDDKINLSTCEPLKDKQRIGAAPIIVYCKDKKTKKQVYENAHAAVTLTPAVKKVLSQPRFPPDVRPLSVLFIGIDSISRLNMMRTMPLTRDHLQNNGWAEIRAYNKMGDNTFPNLMALLTGMNEDQAYAACNPREVGNLDACDFVWKSFQRNGYVTGYAEDDMDISTFNYKKKGFAKPPMHYYFRPYMLAAEKLKTSRLDGMTYCAGPETEGERVLNLAKDFSRTLRDHPSFGFFWMNTYSHNELNSPTRFDAILLDLMLYLGDEGILDTTAVVFLSDHGIRFGDIRHTRSGWLEERLPFLYLSLPKWFREQFPDSYSNLLANADRLTTPYDLHMTLQDLLVHSGYNHTMQPSKGCPNCTSLFSPIPDVRSCEDANVSVHWCACTGYRYINPTNGTVVAAGKFVLNKIQEVIHGYEEGSKCSKYSVGKIKSSSISISLGGWYKNNTYLLIVMETKPTAVFEATVSMKVDNGSSSTLEFELQGGISRLDYYNTHSKCVNDGHLKMYCYC